MGISIAICEKDAPSAPCAKAKKDIKKVLVDDYKQFGDAAESYEIVSLEDAHAIFPDYEAFAKRNRINDETDVIYMEKVKKEDDLAALRPKAVRRYTGWIDLSKLNAADAEKAVSMSLPENRITGWDQVDFDEANAICAACPLSWDKGRGCIGAFGPDNSQLPEIAERRGCKIVASVPEGARTGRIYTPEEAKELAKEVRILTDAMPEEGKMAVRRYSGPVERLGLVADISVKEGCGFYFF